MQILEGTFLTFPLIPLMQLGLLDNVKMYINRKALCKLYRFPRSNTSACATWLNFIAPECTLYCYQWHRTGHLYRGGVNWPKLFRPEAASQLGKFIKAWIDIISDLVHIKLHWYYSYCLDVTKIYRVEMIYCYSWIFNLKWRCLINLWSCLK